MVAQNGRKADGNEYISFLYLGNTMDSYIKMKEYITVKTYVFPHELYIDRSKLESFGIECLTKDEITAQVHNFYSNAIGGIRLQVRTEDFEKANEILSDYPDIKTDEKSISEIKCPNCGSSNINKIKFNRIRSLVALMLFGLPIPFLTKKHQCYECHKEFKHKLAKD